MALKKSKAAPAPAPAPEIKAAPAPAPAPAPEAKASKARASKAAAPKVAADTGAKAGTPKASAKKAEPADKAPKAAAKKPAPIKLTEGQSKFLREIHAAGQDGYKGDKKAQAKSIESLLGKKLIKKGSKDKASGAYHYTVSKAGQKHIEGAPAS